MPDKYVSKIITPFGERLIKAVALATDLWTTLTNTFKQKQTAVPSPTASGSGIQFIDTISQDVNGVITAHKRVVTDASQSLKGLMSAEDKTKLDNITSPFIPKGPASVAFLNGTITGLSVGWLYTLTDSGTLLAGGIYVDVGDEVSWDGSAWYKVGPESYVKTYSVSYDSDAGTWNYPTYSEISADVTAGKLVVLLVMNPAGAVYAYKLDDKTIGLDSSFRFSLFAGVITRTIDIKDDNTRTENTIWNNSVENIAPDYSDLTFPIAEGTQCSNNGKYYYCSLTGGIISSEPWTDGHWTETNVAEQIGNVEALLAAL